jgi:hypothetical protein
LPDGCPHINNPLAVRGGPYGPAPSWHSLSAPLRRDLSCVGELDARGELGWLWEDEGVSGVEPIELPTRVI